MCALLRVLGADHPHTLTTRDRPSLQIGKVARAIGGMSAHSRVAFGLVARRCCRSCPLRRHDLHVGDAALIHAVECDVVNLLREVMAIRIRSHRHLDGGVLGEGDGAA